MIRGCAAGILTESIRSTRSSIRYILDGYAPRDEQEARIYGMKRGLEFIANRQNTITEENLHRCDQNDHIDGFADQSGSERSERKPQRIADNQ